MYLRHATSMTTVFTVTVIFLLSSTTYAHNITTILDKFPEFSKFNQYLTTTHLAAEINTRNTITVCALNDTVMTDLLSKALSTFTIKNVLSFHILLDYYDGKKLHQLNNGSGIVTTLFQSTGLAGSSGFVNITVLKAGKVGFGGKDNGGVIDAMYVKALEEAPYNISVIQIDNMLHSRAAETQTPAPSQVNITSFMSDHGCKLFAESLFASPAEKSYDSNVDGGLTVFCPSDDVFKTFLPTFKNLTDDGKQSLLEFHGVPVYQSISLLKTNNGNMNTLATDGARKFDLSIQNDGETVTLKTKLVTAKITGTVIDQQPLAIFIIDKVLLPQELFKVPPSPTVAPVTAPVTAPVPAPVSEPADAGSPKDSKTKPESPPAPSDPESVAPADAPDGDAADTTASGVARISGGGFLLVLLFAVLVL